MLTKETQYGVEHFCTKAEALVLLKRSRGKGSRYFLSVNAQLIVPEKTNEENYFFYPCYGSVKISLSQAINFVTKLHVESLEEKGARFRISVNDGKYYHIG